MSTPTPPTPCWHACLLLAVLSGCSPRPESGVVTGSRDRVCAGIDNSYACARVVEGQRLGETPEVVRRADTLMLLLASGDTTRLVDHDVGGPDNLLYTYRQYLGDIGYHVVDLHFWEGGAHLLVDDSTGEGTRVPGPPVVSPDHRRLVVASAAGEAGYAPNELQIWRVAPSGLELEFAVRPRSWGATDPRWEDGRTVRFRRSRSGCEELLACDEPAVLRLREGTWEVSSAG